jgi:4-diphosphocytidyl-2-C-methyl-D-erythritol kinase
MTGGAGAALGDRVLLARAPAKVNLGLFVGPKRADGRHELVSVMQSISLADEIELRARPPDARADLVVCPGVQGPNLGAAALAAFRSATGWRSPPVALTIHKRVPVAAGLGGGSGDAAAVLRLAAAASGLGDEALLMRLAAELGADVPAQVRPGRWLAAGAGESLESLADPARPLGVLVLPAADALSTAGVYGELDRRGGGRSPRELQRVRAELHAALELGAPLPPSELLVNDLQVPALALSPAIANALGAAEAAGADAALVSGSGPTVIGLYGRANVEGRLKRALAALEGREPAAVSALPVGAAFGDPIDASVGHN